jgi:hypothetical protein
MFPFTHPPPPRRPPVPKPACTRAHLQGCPVEHGAVPECVTARPPGADLAPKVTPEAALLLLTVQHELRANVCVRASVWCVCVCLKYVCVCVCCTYECVCVHAPA